MMDVDNWTPAMGWRAAAARIPIRTLGAAAAGWGGYRLLRLLIEALAAEVQGEATVVSLGLMSLSGVAAGYIAGHILISKLADSTGLFGLPFWAAATFPFIATLVVLSAVAGALDPDWRMVAFYHYGVTGIAAATVTAKKEFMD